MWPGYRQDSGRGRLHWWRGRALSSQRAVDFVDSAAAGFEADEQHGDQCQDVPAGKVVHGRDQRTGGRLGAHEVGGAGDDREPGRADELAEIAGAIGQPHAAGAQPRRPDLGHVRANDRIAAEPKGALTPDDSKIAADWP